MHAFVRVPRLDPASVTLYLNAIHFITTFKPCTNMSEDMAEDVKPKLSLVINYEGTQITVKVKNNMPFKKIFEAAEVRSAILSQILRFHQPA
ncbi:hypothetical protein DFH29DRAFT_959292 [Suillus ampliporus]|nr:hypothetical protein DFH29DRAFT_959292 [Suillus ampliporus]